MSTLELPKRLERELRELARKKGRPANELLASAVERLIEDAEDIAAADAAMQNPQPWRSSAEVRKRLGLDD